MKEKGIKKRVSARLTDAFEIAEGKDGKKVVGHIILDPEEEKKKRKTATRRT